MINLYKQDGDTLYGIKEFIVDNKEDIANLPTNIPKIRVGSTAFVISSGDIYMLNSSGKWVATGGESSGGSGGSDGNENSNVLIEF